MEHPLESEQHGPHIPHLLPHSLIATPGGKGNIEKRVNKCELLNWKEVKMSYGLFFLKHSKCLNHHNQRLCKIFFDWGKFGAPNIRCLS